MHLVCGSWSAPAICNVPIEILLTSHQFILRASKSTSSTFRRMPGWIGRLRVQNTNRQASKQARTRKALHIRMPKIRCTLNKTADVSARDAITSPHRCPRHTHAERNVWTEVLQPHAARAYAARHLGGISKGSTSASCCFGPSLSLLFASPPKS